jgi:hypothetical protein
MSTQNLAHSVVGDPEAPYVLATVGDERTLLIDLTTRRAIQDFPIEKDTNAKMCVCARDGYCIIGSWRKGLSCYNISTGKLKWRNPKATKINSIKPISPEQIVGIGDRRVCTFDLSDGSILENKTGIDSFFPGRTPKESVMKDTEGVFWVNARRKVRLEWPSFSILDVSFHENRLVASAPDAFVGVYEWGKSEPIDRLQDPRRFFNMMCVHLSEGTHVYGIAAGFQGRHESHAIQWEIGASDFTSLAEFKPCAEHTKADNGRYFIRISGEIFDTKTKTLQQPLQWEKIAKDER